MSPGQMQTAHLDDTILQGLADGSLRGPEGFVAREHCDSCAACAAELEAYAALSASLSALVDPALPSDFTASVLAAATRREEQLAARRQHLLAAIPAAALAIFAVVGWGLSAGLVQRVNEIINGVALVRQVADVAAPVVEVARLPIALGALLLCATIATVLVRALRPMSRPSEA